MGPELSRPLELILAGEWFQYFPAHSEQDSGTFKIAVIMYISPHDCQEEIVSLQEYVQKIIGIGTSTRVDGGAKGIFIPRGRETRPGEYEARQERELATRAGCRIGPQPEMVGSQPDDPRRDDTGCTGPAAMRPGSACRSPAYRGSRRRVAPTAAGRCFHEAMQMRPLATCPPLWRGRHGVIFSLGPTSKRT